MIIGNCPYKDCDEPHMIPCADVCPAFSKETCLKCGNTYWILHSRMTPQAFTADEFEQRYEVDHATKKITDRADARKEGK